MIAQAPTALSLPLRTARIVPRAPLVPVVETTSARFTIDGNAALEQHLTLTCRKIAAGIVGIVGRERVEAILLGGGYGRGEGGVLVTPAGERPYNDLEFYVCLRGNRHLNEARFGRALHVLGEILTPQAGLEVEFKIASLDELARADVSMFSYDLFNGHRCIFGDETRLAVCAHHREAPRIPLSEATRLLMNRGSGLLFAIEKLWQPQFTANDADFVHRNIAKAQLALGDAVLVAHGRYHWSVRQRERALAELAEVEPLPWLGDVRRHHAAGVEFKLHPERSTASRATLLAAQEKLTALAEKIWLWIEQRRLGQSFATARAYAESPANKCPHTSPLRNAALNLRSLGTRALADPRRTRHPRERIFNAMSLLLWEPSALRDPAILGFIQRELHTSGCTLANIMPAYRAIWSRVN